MNDGVDWMKLVMLLGYGAAGVLIMPDVFVQDVPEPVHWSIC